MQMLRVLLTGKPLDGYHVGLVLQGRGATTDFFVPSKLTLVNIQTERLHRSIPVDLRPRIVAKALERRVAQAREAGESFNVKAVERVFGELGATERRIGTILATAPVPETLARQETARARRAKLADALEIKASVTRKDKATGKRVRRTSELYTVAEAIEARAAYRLTDEVEVAREARKAETAARAMADGETLNGALLPKPGSKTRIVLDMMRQEGGATGRDITAALGHERNLMKAGSDFAAKYGLTFAPVIEPTGKRYRLVGTAPAALPIAA